MNARQEALMRYGGVPVRCAWCGSTAGPFELDHVDSQGNAHRRDMAKRGTRLEHELKRLSFPPGYAVLCRRCHDLKSGRALSS